MLSPDSSSYEPLRSHRSSNVQSLNLRNIARAAYSGTSCDPPQCGLNAMVDLNSMGVQSQLGKAATAALNLSQFENMTVMSGDFTFYFKLQKTMVNIFWAQLY